MLLLFEVMPDADSHTLNRTTTYCIIIWEFGLLSLFCIALFYEFAKRGFIKIGVFVSSILLGSHLLR